MLKIYEKMHRYPSLHSLCMLPLCHPPPFQLQRYNTRPTKWELVRINFLKSLIIGSKKNNHYYLMSAFTVWCNFCDMWQQEGSFQLFRVAPYVRKTSWGGQLYVIVPKNYEVKQISPIRLKSTFVGKEATKPGKATTILVEKVNLSSTDKKSQILVK